MRRHGPRFEALGTPDAALYQVDGRQLEGMIVYDDSLKSKRQSRIAAISSLPASLRRREGRFDYLLVESTGISEPLPVAETRLGRRTALTFPLPPPPQKN